MDTASIRAELDHPVIDADGHIIESGSRTSPTNYAANHAANHVNNFAAGTKAVCRSLLFGGTEVEGRVRALLEP